MRTRHCTTRIPSGTDVPRKTVIMPEPGTNYPHIDRRIRAGNQEPFAVEDAVENARLNGITNALISITSDKKKVTEYRVIYREEG